MRIIDCILALSLASAAHAGLLSIAFERHAGTTEVAATGSFEVPLVMDISLDDGTGVPAAAAQAEAQQVYEEPEQDAEEIYSTAPANTPAPLISNEEMKPIPQEPVVQTPAPQQPTAETTSSIERVTTPPKSQAKKTDATPRKQKAQPSKPSKSSTGGTSKRRAGAPGKGAVRSYAAKLRRWVERHKRYPGEARRKRLQGAVRLWVKINRDGTVLASRVTRKSGIVQLDNVTAGLARRASPFPQIPPEFGRTTYTFSVTLRYSLN
ncbi:MAG: energy transducer TonB [Methyloligellaceae bacterium]